MSTSAEAALDAPHLSSLDHKNQHPSSRSYITEIDIAKIVA